MNYNYPNHEHNDFYKDLGEIDRDFFTEHGLKDNLFLDLCRAKTDTNIQGKEVNISIIIQTKKEENK